MKRNKQIRCAVLTLLILSSPLGRAAWEYNCSFTSFGRGSINIIDSNRIAPPLVYSYNTGQMVSDMSFSDNQGSTGRQLSVNAGALKDALYYVLDTSFF
ncbi:hypothetical protein [Citrobacter meridianamericanus]|uniref:Fimbrial protein n=1 Tax=Citrobacter meridianamericanus TaxID=2894201 RepID=A0ABT1BFF9_9ENTR|nr:hypothetical protein [Citrobacter meridianamericanus]MCO5784400.1 hypothetical protein [Citrobacter meridianamericanus]